MPDESYVYVISPKRKGLSAEEYLIRQSGDWRGYVAMMDSGAIDAPPFFKKMMAYYATSMQSFVDVKPEGEGLLMATSVWGDQYLERFLSLCLPSLLEENSLAALKKKKARLFVHTNDAGRIAICNSPVIAELITQGIMAQVMMLNDDVLAMMQGVPHAKYWHLGMVQSLHLQYAKALDMDYHLMMPDVIYSAGYFERLLNLKKPIITHGCVSANEKTLNIDEYRSGLSLSIPASRLMTLALMNAHPRADHHFVKQSKRWPKIHLVILEGKDEVNIMSPHQSIAYMYRKVVRQIPNRIFFTLDSELDKIFNGREIYMPNAKDGLVMAEISGGSSEIYERKECYSTEDFISTFRARIPERALDKIFLQKMSFPIERDIIGHRWYMRASEIEGMQSEVKAMLCPENPK